MTSGDLDRGEQDVLEPRRGRQDAEDSGSRGLPSLALQSDDMLKLLFAHLGDLEDLCRAGSVCRQWRRVSGSEQFWAKLDLGGRVIHQHQILALAQRHPAVRALNLRGIQLRSPRTCSTDHFHSLLFRALPNLVALQIEGWDTSGVRGGGGLSDLAELLPRLERLALHDIKQPGTHMEVRHEHLTALELHGAVAGNVGVAAPALGALVVEGCALSTLSVAAPRLLSLTLRLMACFQDSVVRACVPRLRSLTALDLAGTSLLSDSTLALVGAACVHVTRLCIANCMAVTLVNLQRGFPALRYLDASSCESITHASMVAVESMAGLEEVRLDGCALLTAINLSLPALRLLSARGCRTLAALDLDCPILLELDLGPPPRTLTRAALSSAALAQLAWRRFPALATLTLACPGLVSLDLGQCGAVTGELVAGLTDSLAGCPRLRELVLEACDGLHHCHLSHVGLRRLSLAACRGLHEVRLACPALQELRLDECESLHVARLWPVGVPVLALGSCPRLASLELAAPVLTRLDLRGSGQLERLVLACPALAHLDATFCRTLGDSALAAAVAGAPALAALDLSVCSSLTSGGVAGLARASALTALDLSYSDVADLGAIVAACPGLRALKLACCYALGAGSLAALLPGPAGVPPALPGLTDLDVSYCALPPSALAALLCHGSRFQALGINGCSGATNEVWELVEARSGNAAPTALRALSAVRCKRLRRCWLGLAPAGPHDEAAQRHLLAIGMYSPAQPLPTAWALRPTMLAGLQALRLGGAGVRSVALALPGLTALSLSNAGELRNLELRCPALLAAHMEACRLVPDAMLEAALAASVVLETLDAQHLDLAPDTLRRLQAAHPRLRTL